MPTICANSCVFINFAGYQLNRGVHTGNMYIARVIALEFKGNVKRYHLGNRIQSVE